MILDTCTKPHELLNTAVGGQTAAVHTCPRLLEHDGKTPLHTTTEKSVSGTTGPIVALTALNQVGFLVVQHVEVEVHRPASYSPFTEQWLQAAGLPTCTTTNPGSVTQTHCTRRTRACMPCTLRAWTCCQHTVYSIVCMHACTHKQYNSPGLGIKAVHAGILSAQCKHSTAHVR